tara:strand:+ start:1294 stop:2055 length:762 start_codon:yes stop_codon:yes gene_type:complete
MMISTHKTICITGASSGIGEALALAYATPNTHLLLLGRNIERLTAIKQQCEAKGASTVTQSIDITNQLNLEEWLLAQDHKTPIDLLIANAGCSSTQLTSSHTSQNNLEQRLWNIHLNGTLNTIHPLIPHMQQRQSGHIVIMSSINALIPTGSSAAYGAAKAALLHYGKSLQGKLATSHITVSVLCPGWIKTPLTDQNRFPMPFMLSAHKAALYIQKKLNKKKHCIIFPWPMRWLARCYQFLPSALQRVITQRT